MFSDEEENYRKGFDEADLVAPQVPSYPPHPVVEKPAENLSQLPPGFRYNLNWAMGDIYAYWGGFVSLSCENVGENDIFVYRYGIVVNWTTPSSWIYEEGNVMVPVGEEKTLGLVCFDAPNTPGNYSYHLIISLLVRDNDLLEQFNIDSWYDNGTTHGNEFTLSVKSLEEANEIKTVHNYKTYFDKLKKNVDFEDPQVQTIVSTITARYEGDYNIYQVLAVYDYMVNDLTYIKDPEGSDDWSCAGDTLDRGGGDCEDYAILLSSMVGALGGTTKVYLTETHAFSALYIGNESEKNEILEGIEIYYGTEPNFVVFKDDTGHWLAADPPGSIYLGGLPADAEPALISEYPLIYGFNFKDTAEIHILDILG